MNKEKNLKMIEEVELFIKQLYELDITIDPRADKIRYINPDTRGDVGSLATWLSSVLIVYQANRTDEKSKVVPASMMQEVIIKLYSNGVVNPGEGLIRKNRECLKRKEDIENELKTISSAYMELKKQYDDLKEQYDILAKNVKLPDDNSLEERR